MALTLARLRRLTCDRARESDGRLLEAYLRGDQSAFRELVDRHATLVYGVCSRILRHHQDAEDAFQAVFLVLARRAAVVWPQDAVGSWLYGVATRVAVKAGGVRTRRQAREQPLEDVAATPGSAPECDLAEIIIRAVQKLPEVYRAAIVACDLEGLPRRNAAIRLGWTEGTLSGRLARARKLLADRLRKGGTSLSAAGLAGAMGTNAPVHGRLIQTATELAFSTAGIPAPIATLTHGVTSNMFLFKLKTIFASVFVVGALGMGAWTAGAGDDPGGLPAGHRGPVPPPAKAQPKPDVAKLREELKRLEQDVGVLHDDAKNARGDKADDVRQRIQEAEGRLMYLRELLVASSQRAGAEELSPALKPLQGRWKVEKAVADGKPVPPLDSNKEQVFEIKGSTMDVPYLEGGGLIRREEYKIAVDDTKAPNTIDLIKPGRPVVHGIYEFTAPATTCITCHQVEKGGLKLKEDSKPTDKLMEHQKAKIDKAVVEARLRWLQSRLYDDQFFLTDSHSENQSLLSLPNLRGICGPGLKAVTGLRLAIAEDGPRPTKFAPEKGVIEIQLTRLPAASNVGAPPPIKLDDKVVAAERALRRAQAAAEAAMAQYEEAQARLQVAKVEAERARLIVEMAKARAAEAKAAGPKKPTPVDKGEKSISIHIRPRLSPETVISLEPKQAQTVLEGLAHAAKDMAIDPGAVSVWVVRGREDLPVNLVAITTGGDSSTNYRLQPGDRLFVQTKADK